MTTKSDPHAVPVDAAALAALVAGHHESPHDILGPHPHGEGCHGAHTATDGEDRDPGPAGEDRHST